MKFAHIDRELHSLLQKSLTKEAYSWLHDKIDKIKTAESSKELYLTYSLLANKVKATELHDNTLNAQNDLFDYLKIQQASPLEMARVYLLIAPLKENKTFFQPKVANLIQIADTGELVTFLKYLILLPDSGNFKNVAVEALRTNIATVFKAISMKNPYPAVHFNDQQWNQMYLKAAFMQLDLSNILEVDERANKDLARIISDYAHERWAASRDIDPLFWRPVARFLNPVLLNDMKRLLKSDDISENKSGALCCFHSERPKAKELLNEYPELMQKVASGTITWENIKD